MKGLIVVLLFCLLPATGFAGFGLPWFNTRPRPVLFDEPPAVSKRPPLHRPVAKRRDVSDQHAAGEPGESGRIVKPEENHGRQAGSTSKSAPHN